MKIPHTIPQFILRAFAQKLTPEELEAQYEGRTLRSEDAEWDVDGQGSIVKPTLVDLCLDLLIKDYPYYVRLTDELNRLGVAAHDKAFAQWEKNLESLERKRKDSEDERIAAVDFDRRSPDHDHDSDDDNYDQEEASANEEDEIPAVMPEFTSVTPVLDRLNDVDRCHVIEELDYDEVPLDIAIRTIPDEHYWERFCNDIYPEMEPFWEHDNSWKRMFIERRARKCIETFHPLKGDLEDLKTQIDMLAELVQYLALHSLLPMCYETPLKPVLPAVYPADETLGSKIDDEGFEDSQYMVEIKIEKEKKRIEEKERQEKIALGELSPEDEEAEKEEEEEDPIPLDTNHFDLSIIVPKFINLKKFSLIYTVAQMETDWEARYEEFTMKDCENLAKTLKLCPTIEIFELNKSSMNDEQTKLLVREGLLLMPHLKVLNLSYNKLECAGAKAIARLICDEDSKVVHTLHTLALVRNQIRNPGAEAIAYALTKNNHLHSLDLRLNYIRENGASDIGHALVINKSVQVLNLAANYLGPRASYVFGKMLRHNTSLIHLDLSSNDLMLEGGQHLVNGLKECKQLLKLDVRMTSMGIDLEYEIMSQLRINRANCGYNLLDRDDVYPPESDSVIELEVEEETEESEEEEEEEEEEEGSTDSEPEPDDSQVHKV